MSPMAFNLGLRFPPAFERVLNSFEFMNLDFLPSLNLACVVTTDYV